MKAKLSDFELDEVRGGTGFGVCDERCKEPPRRPTKIMPPPPVDTAGDMALRDDFDRPEPPDGPY